MQNSKCKTARLILPVVLLIGLSAGAQTGQIKGQVEDPTGVKVFNARVLLIDLTTLETKYAAADKDGMFAFSGLGPVDYEIKVKSPGFATYSERVSLGQGKVVVEGERYPRSVTLKVRLMVAHIT